MINRVYFRIIFVLPVFVLALIFFQGVGHADSSTPGTVYPVMTALKLNNMIKNEGKNKVVVVSVFASWCPPCRVELPQLVHLRSQIKEDDLLVIGISADESLSALNSFLERVKINFPVFLATTDILQTFEVVTIPKMLIFDSKGEVFEIVEGAMPEEQFYSMINYLLGHAHE
jgi:thiol-disulfide isomerase/thioredoxin